MTTRHQDCCSRTERFESLWKQYEGNIKALLRARVSNPADAEDLLQEILLRTYSKLDTVHSEENVKAWLFRISKNAIIDHYRKGGRVQNRPESEVPEYEETHPEVRKDLSRCVEPFIHALPNDFREILVAIDLEGVTQKDYADRVGMPYSTLKSKVQRGRQLLRAIIEDCCHITKDSRGNLSEYVPKTDFDDAEELFSGLKTERTSPRRS